MEPIKNDSVSGCQQQDLFIPLPDNGDPLVKEIRDVAPKSYCEEWKDYVVGVCLTAINSDCDIEYYSVMTAGKPSRPYAEHPDDRNRLNVIDMQAGLSLQRLGFQFSKDRRHYKNGGKTNPNRPDKPVLKPQRFRRDKDTSDNDMFRLFYESRKGCKDVG